MTFGTIPLFYWSEKKFSYKGKENYGDLLSNYLVEKISGQKVKWVHPKKQPWYKWDKKHYLAVGSILAHATKDSIVWGSGIVDQNHPVAPADFRAVRGPRTRNFLLRLGYECPEVYGDPALLLPNYFSPKVEKKYKLGIVPHYVDYGLVKSWYGEDEDIKVVDLLTNDIEATTTEILECEMVVSSSLHGIIVAHAYGIPAVWVKFSDKIFGDDIKYEDYFESVGFPVYEPKSITSFLPMANLLKLVKNKSRFPEANKLELLRKDLSGSSPFNN